MSMRGTSWLGLSVVTLSAAGANMAVGHPRYFNAEDDGCRACHGSFSGPVSPKGTVFPASNKHTMHLGSGYMDTDCTLCHTDGDGFNPFLGSSDGATGVPGVGCTGCHGRDYGGALGDSAVGLRAQHLLAGETGCLVCHPGDPTPLPEDVAPSYYGIAETNVDDPCNGSPAHLENWSVGDTAGLDNDGDGVYDQLDSDCGGPSEVPAVSEWGLIIFALIMLVSADICISRRASPVEL